MGAMLLTLAVCVRNVEMRASEPLASESRSKSNTVKLTVDYGDGVQKRFTQLVWQTHDRWKPVVSRQQAPSRHPICIP